MRSLSQQESNILEVIITNAIKLPGVRVDRTEFLVQTFSKYVSPEKINILVTNGPIEAGVHTDIINREARNLVNKRTIQSSGVSFAAGIPGGFAMAATIPADTIQYFGMSLKLAQELAYIYGYRDLWKNGIVDDEAVRNELILFLGVMFGVSGSAAGLRVLSANMSKQALKRIPQKTLTKTIYYPIIKKIGQFIGVKVTKDTFAKGVAKVIPIIGGVISGGMTYASMKPMGMRLQQTLEETINYSQADYERDIKDVTHSVEDYVDAEFYEIEDVEETEQFKEQRGTKVVSIADEILKFKQLLDMGVITQEEFDIKKKELLSIKM
jgi:hypothetical protein